MAKIKNFFVTFTNNFVFLFSYLLCVESSCCNGGSKPKSPPKEKKSKKKVPDPADSKDAKGSKDSGKSGKPSPYQVHLFPDNYFSYFKTLFLYFKYYMCIFNAHRPTYKHIHWTYIWLESLQSPSCFYSYNDNFPHKHNPLVLLVTIANVLFMNLWIWKLWGFFRR